MNAVALDYDEVNALCAAIKNYEGNAEEAINRVLHEQSFGPLTTSIIELIHPSGRTWTGKKASAKATQPFSQKNGNLYVEVKNKKAYGYLYFPDDGSNTKNHVGAQQFMLRGAETEKEHILNLCLAEMEKEWSE